MIKIILEKKKNFPKNFSKRAISLPGFLNTKYVFSHNINKNMIEKNIE